MRVTILVLLLFAQQPHVPEPPPGWFCSPNGAGAHKCGTCQRETHESEACEDEPRTMGTCTVYCWEKKHCQCPVACVKS